MKEETRVRHEVSKLEIYGESQSKSSLALLNQRQRKERAKPERGTSYVGRVMQLLKDTTKEWSQD
ncbi:MAG TPA: hypothetical protein VE242_02465, partial [Chthoniobacterales bacterium]|nr:hypothetical protein [Chthoniobacterales bacterium]